MGDGFRMIQAHYIQAHFLLWGPVPNRPGLVLVHGLAGGDPWSRETIHYRKSLLNLRSLALYHEIFLIFLSKSSRHNVLSQAFLHSANTEHTLSVIYNVGIMKKNTDMIPVFLELTIYTKSQTALTEN